MIDKVHDGMFCQAVSEGCLFLSCCFFSSDTLLFNKKTKQKDEKNLVMPLVGFIDKFLFDSSNSWYGS